MSSGTIDIDVAVVGAGILGLLVASHAAYAGRRVTVFAGSQAPGRIPPRDSQRNHMWLQSGLLYAPDLGVDFATSMWMSGKALLEYVAMDRPYGKGIFRFRADDPTVEQFGPLAKECRLDHEVQEIRSADARRLLGPFYLHGYRHFRVPDAPFPEQSLMETLFERAKNRRASFILKNVSLKRNDRNGVELLTEDSRYSPRMTVLCAGYNTSNLLAQVNIDSQFKVYRSALLRLYSESTNSIGKMHADLLVDRTTNLAIVQARLRTSATSCLIIGARGRVELQGNEVHNRFVPDNEKAELTALLPPTVRQVCKHEAWTAGHKTEVGSARHWIQGFKHAGLPRLIAAIPGKATMALRVAQEIMKYVNEESEPLSSEGGWSLTEVPDFRHHTEYNNVDESFSRRSEEQK